MAMMGLRIQIQRRQTNAADVPGELRIGRTGNDGDLVTEVCQRRREIVHINPLTPDPGVGAVGEKPNPQRALRRHGGRQIPLTGRRGCERHDATD